MHDKYNLIFTGLYYNWIFWLCFLFSTFYISIKYGSCSSLLINIFMGFSTMFLTIYFGYHVHVNCHNIDHSDYYKTHFSKLFPENINNIIYFILKYTLDFHDKIHHDTSINKHFINILIEICVNLVMEGFLFILFLYYFDFYFSIFGQVFKFNLYIVLFWTLLYSSAHNINLLFIPSDSHIHHHKDKYTNYIYDEIDIFFETKYGDKIDCINHGALNIILILFAFECFL